MKQANLGVCRCVAPIATNPCKPNQVYTQYALPKANPKPEVFAFDLECDFYSGAILHD